MAKKALKATKSNKKPAKAAAKKSVAKPAKKPTKASAGARAAKGGSGLISVAPGFTANDAAASIKWYCDVLGFSV